MDPTRGSDSCTAVGAAFFVWNRALGNPRTLTMRHAYTSPEYDDTRTLTMRHAYTSPEYDDTEFEAAVRAAGLDAAPLDYG